jgi:O-antigen ligase
MEVYPLGFLLSNTCSAIITHFSVRCYFVHLTITKCYIRKKKFLFPLLTLTISLTYNNFWVLANLSKVLFTGPQFLLFLIYCCTFLPLFSSTIPNIHEMNNIKTKPDLHKRNYVMNQYKYKHYFFRWSSYNSWFRG